MDKQQPDVMMPVPEDHAVRMIEIEAIRQVTDNLRRLNGHAEKTNEALDRVGERLHSIDIRLVKIESNRVSEEVSKLQAEVDLLKQDKARREGALGLGNWVLKNWPSIIGILLIALLILKSNNKL